LAELDALSFRLKDGRDGVLRSARPADAATTLELYRAVVNEGAYTLFEPDELKRDQEQEEHNIRNEQTAPNRLRLVAEIDGEVVGMARVSGGELARTAHFGEVDSVWVQQDCRGQGIGRSLMQTLETWARQDGKLEKLGLYVFSTNERAVSLYTSLGYVIEGRCPKDIKFGENQYADTLVMGKLLS
jgi:ribosomal protein S18 acetylase RimI-like enzyme